MFLNACYCMILIGFLPISLPKHADGSFQQLDLGDLSSTLENKDQE